MANNAVQKQKKKKRLIKRIILWVILLAIAAFAVRFILWPRLLAETTVTYDKYAARIGTISNALSFNGSVSVKNNETHTAEGSATVRQIFVQEEELVEKDQKLMRLSDGTNIKASFDGQVNAIGVEVGDDVSMGESLIQIVDFNNMTVSLRVDEYAISSVKVGQECTVTVTALGETFPSTISHINRVSSSMGNTAYYTVTAELTVTEDVLPGMQATVSILQEEAVDSVILSQSALSFAPDNSAYVLMYDEAHTLQPVPVELGIKNDSYVEITSGLKDGDEVYKVADLSNANSLMQMASMFDNMGGGQQTMPQQGGYNQRPGNMGGGFSQRPGSMGGGSFGGGMPGGMR